MDARCIPRRVGRNVGIAHNATITVVSRIVLWLVVLQSQIVLPRRRYKIWVSLILVKWRMNCCIEWKAKETMVEHDTTMTEGEAADLVSQLETAAAETVTGDSGKLLKPRDAVEYLAQHNLHVSKATIARWARRGYLRSMRIPSGQVRVYQSSLDAILAGTVIAK
jgi:hypothetical protein